MSQKPHILVVDDDMFHMGQIKRDLGENAAVTALTPQELMDKSEQSFFEGIDLALIDYDFKKFTSIDAGVSQFLRKMGCTCSVLLCSLHKEFPGDLREVKKNYDDILDKEELSWPTLEPYLKGQTLH